MKRSLNIFWNLILVAILMVPMAYASETIDLGTRRELFVDHYLIDSMSGDVTLKLSEPRNEGVVLEYDQPWEGRYSGYGVFMQVGENDYRYYYRGSPRILPEPQGVERRTCLALSKDGIHWEKPDLGRFEVYGTKKNNVLLMEDDCSHNFAPFIDKRPGVPKSERFKALAGERYKGLFFYASADGMNWKKMFDGKSVLQGKYLDAMNVAFWSEAEEQYVLYARDWVDGWNGWRWIAKATSPDLENWTPLQRVTILHDKKEVPRQHYYHTGIQPYFRAPHIYISLCSMLHAGQALSDAQVATLDIEKKSRANHRSGGGFMTSRGGLEFQRTFMEEFVRPPFGTSEWLARCNYPCVGIVQTGPTEISFYTDIRSGQPTHAVRRYSLRLDGFASLYAPFDGGEVVTKPFTFSGDRLSLNFATAAQGEISIRFETPDGKVIPGYDFCKPIIGNEVDYHVLYNGSTDLSSLAGKTVRLRIKIKDANLYSIQFQPESNSVTTTKDSSTKS